MDPLVTTDWLAAHLDDEKVRVVDIRGYVDKADLGGGRQTAADLLAQFVEGQSTSLRCAAQRLSSWRLDSCSLRSTEDTCASTVFAEIESRSAISLYM